MTRHTVHDIIQNTSTEKFYGTVGDILAARDADAVESDGEVIGDDYGATSSTATDGETIGDTDTESNETVGDDTESDESIEG
jgi:hypothetical protein